MRPNGQRGLFEALWRAGYLVDQSLRQGAGAPPVAQVLHGAGGAAELDRGLRDGQAQVEGDAGFRDGPLVPVRLTASGVVSAALVILPALTTSTF